MSDAESCVSISDGMPEHPKILAAGGDAAWLWVCSIAYARRNNTDGIIPAVAVPRLSDRRQPMRLAKMLTAQRLWHESGHDCDACAQPLPGNYVIHDYLQWQPGTAEQAAAEAQSASVREAKETGGAYGNHRRWHVGRSQPDPLCEFCASHMRSDNRSDSESDNRSHMRSVEGSLTDRSTESGANRTSDDLRTGQDGNSPSPPVPPPPPRVDTTPPTPPSTRKPRAGRQAYDYAADLDFGRFWDVFPVKSGKPAAYAAWLKARARNADPEVIIAAAKAYADDPNRNPEKTKYPQGWLNDERYNDAAPAAPGAPAGPAQPEAWWK